MSERYYSYKTYKPSVSQDIAIYCGKNKVAIEKTFYPGFISGNYVILFFLNGIKQIHGDDREELRREAIRLCNEWFDATYWKPQGDEKP